MSGLSNIGTRSAQIIFAAVVTGLSIDLARGHKQGSVPITLGYVSFVGCVSLLAAFVGLAATWIDFLQGPVGLAIDGFIALVNLAGGLIVAIKLGGVKCKWDEYDMKNNEKIGKSELINGGKFGKGIEECYYCLTPDGPNTMISRCKMNQADTAFMFLTAIVVLVGLTLTFLRMKKGY